MVIIFLLFSLIAALIFFHGVTKKVNEKMGSIAASLNGKLNSSFAKDLSNSRHTIEIVVDYNDVPVKVFYMGSAKYSPPKIGVEALKKIPFSLSLRKENFDTRISKKIGFVKDAEIGIEEFDNEFLIVTNNNLICRSYLTNDQVREKIKSILERGWRFGILDGRITIEKNLTSGLIPVDEIKEREIRDLLNQATFLAKKLG